MSEYALERARAKARRRRHKPRGPRPNGPWWSCAAILAALVMAYVTTAMERRTDLTVAVGGLALVMAVALRWTFAWWLWERQEGLPHHPADWVDRSVTAAAVVFIVGDALWLGGVR